jgi:tetratricopeptide (TPR) repeat protein
MGDAHVDEITSHPASAPLLAAWQATDIRQRQEILDGVPVPGPIALRSRYRHLLDAEALAGPWDAHWSRARWHAVIRLETQGDDAVRRNDVAGARAAFGALLGLGAAESSRVVAVHAHLGFGDIGLAGDDPEVATREYEAALALAAADRYRFGQLRALVGLGYVTLMVHSAGAALGYFAEATALARAVGDPVYGANAAIGLAECEERLGQLDQAVVHAEEAYRSLADFGSALGQGNAAQRLGSMLHRLRRRSEARDWLERARAAFAEAGNPMGMTNVLSGLGDILLEEDDVDGAERLYLEGLRVAEAASLPRSRAHALQDLARVARSRADWETAAERFSDSLAAYRELDDLLGMSNAWNKLAETYVALGQAEQVLRVRMDAVFAIEEYRATHRDERSQREYRNRFVSTYAAALAAATRYGSASSFAVVADCLAGRRLAGLFAETARAAAGAGQLALHQELLVRADQRLVGHGRDEGGAADAPEGAVASEGDPRARRERVVRLLGAAGIKHGLVPQAEASLDDLLAAVYLPPADEGDALLAALPGNCHVVQALIDPQDETLLRWLWRDTEGSARIGVTQLSREATDLIAALQRNDDARIELRITDLMPLRELLPAELRAAFADGDGHRLVLVPVGELWLVPWSAIPVNGGQVLGEVASYVACPSLTVQRQLAARGTRGHGTVPQLADLWRSPFVLHHGLAGFQEDRAWQVTVLHSPAQARERLTAGSQAMVITGHGRPVPGLGHYLELDRDQWLLPVDLIGARAPRRLAVIACWGGAIPGRGPTDPLSLATLALAAGSAEILATVGELADSVPASLYVEQVLAAMGNRPLPEALHAATRWILSDAAVRSERVHHWAPLVPFGTLHVPD